MRPRPNRRSRLSSRPRSILAASAAKRCRSEVVAVQSSGSPGGCGSEKGGERAAGLVGGEEFAEVGKQGPALEAAGD